MHFDRNIDSRSPLLTSDMNKHIRRSTAEVNICQQCKDPRAGARLQTSLSSHQQKKEKSRKAVAVEITRRRVGIEWKIMKNRTVCSTHRAVAMLNSRRK